MVELLTGYLQQQHLEIDDHEFTVQG
jgi:hypothetical protein